VEVSAATYVPGLGQLALSRLAGRLGLGDTGRIITGRSEVCLHSCELALTHCKHLRRVTCVRERERERKREGGKERERGRERGRQREGEGEYACSVAPLALLSLTGTDFLPEESAAAMLAVCFIIRVVRDSAADFALSCAVLLAAFSCRSLSSSFSLSCSSSFSVSRLISSDTSSIAAVSTDEDGFIESLC
jgi:hypothetical protein